MGWFNRSSATSDEIRPISQERLKALMDREGWHYQIDDDGDLGGRWDNSYFYFILAGRQKEILHIVARMREEIPQEVHDEFLVFIEDWHRDKIWPKAYYSLDNAARMFLHAEVNVDHEHGASDAQLFQQIKCALGTCGQLFDAVRERFGITPLKD